MNTSEQSLQVIFGTGPLGKAVMRALVARGERVRMINRSGRADVPAGVEVIAADAYDPQSALRAAKGASVIYQCAQPGYAEWPTKFPPLQTSILHTAEALSARLVIGDNLYMYGEVTGPIHEDLPYNAHTIKGQTRAAMAKQALEWHQAGRVQTALVRGSDFYGPEALGSSMGERVFIPMLKGKAAQIIGDIDTPHSYTFISDFGKAMAIVGQHESALGRAWHVPNPPTLTTRQFVELAFAQLGQPARISRTTRWMIRLAGLFVPDIREVSEMMYEFEQPHVLDASQFIATFGDISTPYDEALRITLDWYRAHLGLSAQPAA